MFTQGDKDSLLSFADGTKPKASGSAAGSAASTSTLSSASGSGASAQNKTGVNAEGIICSLLQLTTTALSVVFAISLLSSKSVVIVIEFITYWFQILVGSEAGSVGSLQ